MIWTRTHVHVFFKDEMSATVKGTAFKQSNIKAKYESNLVVDLPAIFGQTAWKSLPHAITAQLETWITRTKYFVPRPISTEAVTRHSTQENGKPVKFTQEIMILETNCRLGELSKL